MWPDLTLEISVSMSCLRGTFSKSRSAGSDSHPPTRPPGKRPVRPLDPFSREHVTEHLFLLLLSSAICGRSAGLFGRRVLDGDIPVTAPVRAPVPVSIACTSSSRLGAGVKEAGLVLDRHPDRRSRSGRSTVTRAYSRNQHCRKSLHRSSSSNRP